MLNPKPGDPFYVQGKLQVHLSATVICARRRRPPPPRGEGANNEFETLGGGDFLSKEQRENGVDIVQGPMGGLFQGIFSDSQHYRFVNHWEVLLGQNEVINYLKSEENKFRTARYAGEFKVAGGNVDPGETLEQAAKRELFEEFIQPLGVDVPLESIVVRPFSVKQTRPIRSRSNLMCNFVAFESENRWLQDLDVDKINANLEQRRERFTALVNSGEYWTMSKEAREKVSPEVHRLEWLSLRDAVLKCMTSLVPGMFANDWQKDQFKLLSSVAGPGKSKRRDPMFMTAATLVELDIVSDESEYVEYIKAKGGNRVWEELKKEEQFLYSGMSNEQVTQVLAERAISYGGVNPSFKTPASLEKMRAKYEAEIISLLESSKMAKL